MNNRIEQLRKAASMTQQDLADRVEVSRQTVISLESGRYNPSILLARKIARVFSLPIESVFIFEEDVEHV